MLLLRITSSRIPRDPDRRRFHDRGRQHRDALPARSDRRAGHPRRVGLLAFFRWLFGLFGSDFFEQFPLFPFSIVGGVLVQLAAVRFGLGWAVNRRAVEGLGGLSIDGIVICAIGTLSLSALGENIGPLLILAAASVAWRIVLVLLIGRRVFTQDWFERSIAEFAEGQGTVATGFMMIDMVDPKRQTGVVQGYSYRQLFTRPFVGGGFISALSVPLIAALGLPFFTIVALVMTVVLTIWGVRRAGLRRPVSRSGS